MNTQPFLQLACPLDGKPLRSDGTSWRCSANHCYDIARQGYTHLLPVQNMASRNPGDSKEMIESRQRFLGAGFYTPVAAAVAKTALDGLAPQASVLDAGCGEGYYLRQLAASIGKKQSLEVIGLDISKPAILSAAKQDKGSTWVVGSNANLPVLTGTLDRVICMFGFPTYAEFARVLKNGGELLMVEAGPDHLRELREIIYPTVKPDKPEKSETEKTPEGFTALATETVQFQFELSSAEQISDLLSMTPHLFRAGAEGKAKAAALESLSLTADVRLLRFEVITRVIEPIVDVVVETVTEPIVEPTVELTLDTAEAIAAPVIETAIEPAADSPIEKEETEVVENTGETEETNGGFDWNTRRPRQ